MLGIKVAATTTLPYWWAKLKKWQASARPVRERAELGTELVTASAESGDAPTGGHEPASLVGSLHELRTFTRRVARSAEPLSTPDAEVLAKIIAGLLKMEHKVLHYIETLSAPEDPEPEPKPDMTQVLRSAAAPCDSRAPRMADATPLPAQPFGRALSRLSGSSWWYALCAAHLHRPEPAPHPGMHPPPLRPRRCCR
jgi:hypothetical protein